MAKKPALGLVINEKTIEVLAVELVKGKFLVTSYAWGELPRGVVSAGRVVEPRLLAAELKKLGQKGPVVLGLSQAQVFLKIFTIPKFEEKELEEAISWQVGALWPELPRDAYTAYEVIEKGSQAEVKVLVAAVPKPVIDGYLEVLEAAGIKVRAIEPIVLAKARLIDPRQLLGKSVVSVHLYAGKLAVSVLVNGKLWFSKERDRQEIEKESQIRAEVMELVRFFSDKKEKEVAEVSEIIYGGDRGGVTWLEKTLRGLSLPLVKAEAGVMLAPSKAVSEAESLMFAPVLGLAVRGRMQQKGLIDLLPDWPKERTTLARLMTTLSWAGIAAGLTIWLLVIILETGWWWVDRQQKALVRQKETLEQELKTEPAETLAQWGDRFNQVVRAAELIETSRFSQSQLLTQLAGIVPKTVRLTTFSYQGPLKEWLITGVAAKREDILALDKTFKTVEFFKGARLYFSSLETSEGVVFRFVGGKNEP